MNIIQRLAAEYSYKLITVASFNHRIDHPNHVITGDENQATDIAVINQTHPGDIVVTQDWGLAALVLGKKAKAITPHGRIYKAEQMDLLLEERNILAKIRRSGGRTKGPAKWTPKDGDHFARNFEMLLSECTKMVDSGNET